MSTGNTLACSATPAPNDPAAIEPGHVDREHMFAMTRTERVAIQLQLSPVMSTGNTIPSRIHSARTIVRLDVDTKKAKDFAAEILRLHKPGTLTLVVINTVDRATEIYTKATALAPATGPAITLLHSRFRPCERDSYIDRIGTESHDDILIATQVVEAGIDLDAATLITEAAPWSSLVQRSGRCNRAGERSDATVYWVVPPSAAPYEDDDVDATVAALTAVNGNSVTNAELLATPTNEAIPLVPVLREGDFESLFDTAPDLSGNDFDVSPYIRDSDDMDAQLTWVDLESAPPTSDTKIPDPQFRCRVPLRKVLDVATRATKRKAIWSYAHSERKWVQISKIRPPRPGEILLVDKSAGLYDPQTGFDPKSDKPVTVPEPDDVLSREYRLIDSAVTADSSDADVGSIDHPRWLSLDQHLAETQAQASILVEDLPLESALKDDVVLSAYLHDLGKAHSTWQKALQATGEPPDRSIAWAKSPGKSRLVYEGGITSFRHELASVAMLDAEMSHLLDGAHDRDLVRYLIAAHHGKIRVKVRDLDGAATNTVFGIAAGGADVFPVLDTPTQQVSLTTDQFRTVNPDGQGWVEMTADLIERYGLCRLAFLEMLVRVADWRASSRQFQTPEGAAQ